ncbi:MAG: hypothetical protein ACHP7I_06105 [Terriglobales bacterium]
MTRYKMVAWGSCVGGLAGIALFHGYVVLGHQYAALPAVSEAIFIAGFLALVVDPYLKKHFREEILKDSFAQILAPDLPVEIRDRIEQIARKTALYRRDYIMKAKVEDYYGQARVEFSYEYQLFNATRAEQKFTQELMIDDHDNGHVESMSLVVDDGEGSYDRIKPTVEKKRFFSVYRGPTISVLPSNTKAKYTVKATWVCTKNAHEGWSNHLALPTVGAKVITEAPMNFEAADLYCSSDLIMTGEHIEVYWKKKIIEY